MSEPLVTVVGGEGAVELADRIAAAATPVDDVHLIELRRTADPGVPVDEIALRLETALRLRSRTGAPIEQVVVAVEAGESVLPVTAAVVLLGARRVATMDCAVISVHGPAATVRLASGDAVVPASTAAGLAIADRVVLGGAARLTERAFVEVATALRRANRLGPIVAPGIGGLAVGALLSTGCWSGALRVGPPAPLAGDETGRARSAGASEPVHDAAMPDEAMPYEAMSFELPAPVPSEAVRSVVERLVSRWPGVLRVQACVRVEHGAIACIQAMGTGSLASGRLAISCRLMAAEDDATCAGGPAGAVTVVAPAALRGSIDHLLAMELLTDGAGWLDAKP